MTLTPSADAQPNPYAQAALIADEHLGFDLQTDKAPLIGVPFIITGVTFRDGEKIRNTSNGKQRVHYVSAELLLGDADAFKRALDRGRISAAQLQAFDACERIVVNDGSTGLCRQIVAYLAGKGLVTLPDGPESGGAGESRYDTFYADWLDSEPDNKDEGGDPHFTIALNVKRGLKPSEYQNDYGDGMTYYLA